MTNILILILVGVTVFAVVYYIGARIERGWDDVDSE